MRQSPIFIGGLDRSGKTLLRLALSSHPNIVMTRRTYMWRKFNNRFGDLADRENFERCLNAMLAQKTVRFLEPDPEKIRREFIGGNEFTYARLFSLLHEQYAERLGKTRWGEQEGSIEHFSHQIVDAYPAAKIIHMLRDPRARYGEEIKAGVRNRPGKAGSRTGDWLASVQAMASNISQYPNQYLVLRFEDLLTHPEEKLKEVCDFLGEDYSPSMRMLDGAVRFGPDDEADQTQGWASGRVQEYLSVSSAVSPQDVAFIENFAGAWMERYGYTLLQKRLTLIQTFNYYLTLPLNRMQLKPGNFEENKRNLI